MAAIRFRVAVGYDPEPVELVDAASASAALPINAVFVPLTKLSLTAMWPAALPNDPAALLARSRPATFPADCDAVRGGPVALDALRSTGGVCATETLAPALACAPCEAVPTAAISLALDPAPVTADPLPAGKATVAGEPAPAEATGAAQVPPDAAAADGAAETTADDPPAEVLGREAPHDGVTVVATVAVDEDPTGGGLVVEAVVVPVVVLAVGVVAVVVVVVVVVVAGVVVVTDPVDGAVAVDPFGAALVVVVVDVPPGAVPDVPGDPPVAAVDDDADVDAPAGVAGREVLSCIAAPAPLKLVPAGAGVPASADAAAHRSMTADIAAQMPAL